jgi:hypothetical protein
VYGKFGRGHRPLIFSTELARSAEEFTTTPARIQEEILRLVEMISRDTTSDAEARTLQKEIEALIQRRERAVAVYGMITARTDGRRMIVTQKLEAKRGSTGERWDIHCFEPGADGRLRYLARH